MYWREARRRGTVWGGATGWVGGVDLCESTHTMPLSVWTAQPAMVRYSLTYPVATPFTTRYAPGLQKRGGGGLGLCIFLLSSLTWSPQRKRPVWWPCGQIYLSCSGKHKLGPFQEWTLSTCARCRESHEAHMHAHLSVDDSCHHHIRGIGMTRLRQVNYLSFWFSFCSLLLPPTSHSSNIAPLVMHKLVPFSHSLSCSSCRHPPPLSTFNFPTTFIFILSRYLDRV